LKADIAKAKDVDALTKWATDPKNRARLNKLDETETERVRSHYASAREQLSNVE